MAGYSQLGPASDRAREFGRPGNGDGRRDPLEARGQAVRTLSARIHDDRVTSAGFLAEDATRKTLSDDDAEVLLALTPGASPVNRTLSSGAYRLVAARAPYGDVIVTGLPLKDKQNTLASLASRSTPARLPSRCAYRRRPPIPAPRSEAWAAP